MTCTIEVAANGEALNGAGLPTRLLVYGRITSGSCTGVRCSVRPFQSGPVLLTAEAEPDSNGTWACEFPLAAAPIACGTPLWIEAQCVDGGACSVAQTVQVACKSEPDGGGGSQPPGSGGNGGGNNGDGNGWQWPWPWPPAVFCPAVGRVFTQVLLLAVVALLAGVALVNAVVVGSALAVIGGAFGLLGVWRFFCQPHSCYVLGAILWVAKRCTIAALILLVLAPHLAMLLALWTTGAVAGILTGWLRKRRCPIPSVHTPLNQLPVW